VATTTDAAADTGVEHEDVHHPTPGEYVRIGILLALLTALEVSLFYIALTDAVRVTSMLILMVVKFGTVVAFYMHLKFDSHLFRRLMLAGLVLAAAVYGAVLAMFTNVTPPGT
jgi:cytochrome c oxidase subunit 4